MCTHKMAVLEPKFVNYLELKITLPAQTIILPQSMIVVAGA